MFEPNAGRYDPAVRFVVRGQHYALALGDRETRVVAGRASVATRLLAARPVPVTAAGKPVARMNSFVGKDPARWVRNAPLYRAVAQRGVYNGIDLVHHVRQGALEYDFRIAPHADPSKITFAVTGANPRLTPSGDLRLGVLTHRKPVAYQWIDGRRVHVDARFAVDGNRVTFDVGDYDHGRRLVIDPVLAYSTYVTGTGADIVRAIAVGPDRSAYLAGTTTVPDIQGGDSTDPVGGIDAFIAKLTPDGGAMSFLTYLGGGDDDTPQGVDADSEGNVYVGGTTKSANLPTPLPDGSTLYTAREGTTDAFVAKLDSAGALTWSTYLGGDGVDEGHALQVDPADEPTIVGSTATTTTVAFPASGTSADASYNGGASDGFVTKIAADGSGLDISTLLGGSLEDKVESVTFVGASTDPLFGGTTYSTNFPTASPPTGFDTNHGAADMFYGQLNASSAALSAGGYVGGTGDDFLHTIVETPALSNPSRAIRVWVAGETYSSSFMGVSGNHGGSVDGVAMELDSGTVHFIGGDGVDTVQAGVADAYGNVAFAGLTNSSESSMKIGTTDLSTLHPFDTSQGTPQGTFGLSAYVAKFTFTTGRPPYFASYLSGTGSEWPYGIAADSGTGIYVAGQTGSDDFPTTQNALSPIATGTENGFVSKIGMSPVALTGTSGFTKTSSATFDFSTADTGVTFTCELSPASQPGHFQAPCGPSRTYNGLGDGKYTFKLRASDAGLATDTYEREFTVDTTPPSAPVLKEPAAGAQTSRQPTFSWDPATDSNKVTEYRLEIGDASQTVDALDCCQATAATALVTGVHSWRVVAVDAAGNFTPSESRSFTAVEQPSARFSIAPNPALLGRTVTFDGSASADASHTIIRYEWDLDGDGSYETDGGATPTASRSYDKVQTIQVGLRVTDSTNLAADSHQELRVTTQTIAGQFGVSINNGAQYTRTPNVTITASFPSGITSMLFSNDGGFFAPQSFAPARETKWKLDSSGPERLPKIVYIRFLTGLLTSETHTDDIILDETPPTVQAASLLGGGTSSAAQAAKARKYTLKLKAKDSNSGVAGVQVTANKRKPGKLLKYKTKLSLKAAAKPKWVRARDRAGNFSRWRKVR